MSADKMMKAEIAKQRAPMTRARKLGIAGALVGAALLTGGGVWGANAAIDYRADIQQSQDAAQEYYEAAQEQAQIANDAADKAAAAAETATESTTSLEASEAQAIAAAAAVEAQQAANVANGLTPEGKCPSGTVAGAVDDNGIESNCSATSGGAQCVAYDDNNNCTQYYKP